MEGKAKKTDEPMKIADDRIDRRGAPIRRRAFCLKESPWSGSIEDRYGIRGRAGRNREEESAAGAEFKGLGERGKQNIPAGRCMPHVRTNFSHVCVSGRKQEK